MPPRQRESAVPKAGQFWFCQPPASGYFSPPRGRLLFPLAFCFFRFCLPGGGVACCQGLSLAPQRILPHRHSDCVTFNFCLPGRGASFSNARKRGGKKGGQGSSPGTPQAGLCVVASEVFCVAKSPAAPPSADEGALLRGHWQLWPGRQKLLPRVKLAAQAALSAVPKAEHF